MLINGTDYYLRNDNTIYLGMDTWWRPLHSTCEWTQTDNYGRVTLIPEMEYETVNSGSLRISFFERLRRFFHMWL